ncbi:MAG TPA: hypothetical protein VGC63_00960 [Solirubrobacterales bacterium]|jgi:hypothetical protein
MKFAVGVLLTTFGVFWSVEGAGVAWPGGDVALAPLFPAWVLPPVLVLAILLPLGPRRQPLGLQPGSTQRPRARQMKHAARRAAI